MNQPIHPSKIPFWICFVMFTLEIQIEFINMFFSFSLTYKLLQDKYINVSYRLCTISSYQITKKKPKPFIGDLTKVNYMDAISNAGNIRRFAQLIYYINVYKLFQITKN